MSTPDIYCYNIYNIYCRSIYNIYCYRMRDAGLSIKAWMDINDNSYSAVKDVLEAYVGQSRLLIMWV